MPKNRGAGKDIFASIMPMFGMVMMISAISSMFQPPVSAKGHIVINTIPTGATITVNGSAVGVSPITVDVDPGSYTVLIQLSGYNDATTNVTVAVGETHTLNASLTEVGGRTPIDIIWT